MYIKNTSWIQLKYIDRMLIPIYHYYKFVFVILMFYLLSSWPNQRPTWTMYCTVGGRKPRSLTSKERPRKSQKRLNTLSESIWYVANTTLHNDDFLFFFLFIFFSFENEMQQKLMEKLYGIQVLFSCRCRMLSR